MSLKYKNILITGAGKGIGETSVYTLLEEGAFVFALIKNKKDNYKFKNLKNLKIYNGDVQNFKLIEKILADSVFLKKPINTLINNAGVRFRKQFLKIKTHEIERVFNINFFSILKNMQTFSKFVIKKKTSGNIINISSIVGSIGFKELSIYAATKGALNSLTQSFATEMVSKNIRANLVSPGFTKTSYFKKFKKKKKLYDWTLTRIPMNRWGESVEVSNLIVFLASDKSSYINGENINIDGGWINS